MLPVTADQGVLAPRLGATAGRVAPKELHEALSPTAARLQVLLSEQEDGLLTAGYASALTTRMASKLRLLSGKIRKQW